MPMGLNISLPVWQSNINVILDCLQSRKYCEAIMDDILLFTPSKDSHNNKLEDLLKALLRNGLKISPKEMPIIQDQPAIHGKCNTYTKQKVCVQPSRNRLEAIQKITTPKDSKSMQEFCRYGELPKHVLPRTTEIIKAYL